SDSVAVRSLRHECIALARRGLRKTGGIDVAVDRFINFPAVIERTQAGCQSCAGALAGDVSLGDYKSIGKDRLLACFRRPAEGFRSCDRIHDRHDSLYVKNNT